MNVSVVVSAQSEDESRPSVEKFGDWEVICSVEKDSYNTAKSTSNTSDIAAEASISEERGLARQSCKMVQNHVIEGSEQTVFLMNVLFTNDDKKPVAVISVPLGVYLVPGIDLKIDSRSKMKILFEACNRSGCHAGFPLRDSVLSQMKRGLTAKYTLKDTSDKEIDVRVSLKGFTAAFNSLNSQNGTRISDE